MTKTETSEREKNSYNRLWLAYLALILLMWRIWWAANNASKWQVGLNSAFKGLIRRMKLL